MLDIKFIRENPDLVKQGIRNKNMDVDIDLLLKYDEEKRELLGEVERLKQVRNESSKQIGLLKRDGKPCGHIMEEMKEISDQIAELDDKVRDKTNQIDGLLIWIPNIAHESVPVGKDSTSNVVVREWGSKPAYNFETKSHIDLGEKLDILDFARATKLSGS
ncbi:MAG: serine--tRNA ligase, partial [Candidatus Auribacter fodinae]